MTESRLRSCVKRHLPQPLRRLLRACRHYAQRVGRWPIILWQVRGDSWRDQWMLILSALAAPVLALRSPLDWQDPILLADVRVHVPGAGRFRLRERSDDLWHVLPWREAAVWRTMTSLLRPGDVFVDAGANIGIYTVLASKLVGSHGRVVSIEMMPDTADRLRGHIDANGRTNVTVVVGALSDTGGASVMASVPDGKYGQASISEGWNAGGARVQVETVSLDQVTAGIPAIRLMKMDIEGAEPIALSGADATLSVLDHLIYESRGQNGAERDAVAGILKRHGFGSYRLDGNNWLASKHSPG